MNNYVLFSESSVSKIYFELAGISKKNRISNIRGFTVREQADEILVRFTFATRKGMSSLSFPTDSPEPSTHRTMREAETKH